MQSNMFLLGYISLQYLIKRCSLFIWSLLGFRVSSSCYIYGFLNIMGEIIR